MSLYLLLDLPLNDELKRASFYNEEAVPDLTHLEHESTFLNITIEHLLFDVLQFALGEVIEDEVVLEASKDEVRICHGLFLGDDLDVLSNSCLHHLHLFLLLNKSRFT